MILLIYSLFYFYSLANVDPVDVARNISGLDPETTLGDMTLLSVVFRL